MIIIKKTIEIMKKSRRSRYLQLLQLPMKTLSPGKEMVEAEEGAKSNATTKLIVSMTESSRWRTIVSTEREEVSSIRSSTSRSAMTSREKISKTVTQEEVVTRDAEEEVEMIAHLVKISNIVMRKREEETNKEEAVVVLNINRRLGEVEMTAGKMPEAERTKRGVESNTSINR